MSASRYTVKLKGVPKGHVAPPLLAKVGAWLAGQKYGAVGYFELVASAVPGSWSGVDWKKLQQDAWCFMTLPDGSLVALLDATKPEPVVLLDSESDKLKVLAASLEEFLAALGAAKTRIADLDEGDGHGALAAWLKAKNVRASRGAKFDLAAYVRSAMPVVESPELRKQPPVVRQFAALLGRSTADDKLPAELAKVGLGRPRGSSPLRNAKKGITIKFARRGKEVVISEVHLGEKYDGPLPFKLHNGGSNDSSVKKVLGKPSTKLKAKGGGPVWEKILDADRGIHFQRSRGHFDWWSEHRLFLTAPKR